MLRPRIGQVIPWSGHIHSLRRGLAVHATLPWYDYLKHDKDRAAVREYRFQDYAGLSSEELSRYGDRWVKKDKSTKFEMEVDGKSVLVRPFWISIRTRDTGMSELYASLLPVDEMVERGFLSESEPQAIFGREWSFKHCDRRSGRWRGYFVGLVGDIGRDWRDGLSPIIVFHEKRRVFELQSFNQIGQFLADPTKGRIEMHYNNLKRVIDGQPSKNYLHGLLEERWGREALLRNKIQL